MPSAEAELRALMVELSRINSELVTQQRETARAQVDAVARDERARQYAGMVAHDLANPLQVVLGSTELLLDDPELPDVVRDRLARIKRSALLMQSLVRDLTAGLDADEAMVLETSRFDIRELVASVVARHQILTAPTGLELGLETCVDPVERCLVDGDVLKLERALNNLIGNAVKFSPAKGRVEITLRRLERDDAAWAEVSVTDHGPGIDPAAHETIFEMFHREEATAQVPGVGLGLYITRQIAERHGGTVTVRSRPGEGATFLLTLPLVEG